uniref:Uncharacterized protein n=1 Tax=Trichuris muris TaxID=70415 RepID=A0A5S6QR84_TRIMR
MRQKSYLHSTLYSPEPVSSKRNRRKSGYKLSHDSSERASLFSGLTSMRACWLQLKDTDTKILMKVCFNSNWNIAQGCKFEWT